MKSNSNNSIYFDESNINENNRYNRKHQKNIYYCNITILMILLLIMNLIVIIKIFDQLKGLNSMNYKNKPIYSDNQNQQKQIDLYTIPLETMDSNILTDIQNQLLDYIELTIDEQKFFNGLLRKIKPMKVVEIGVSSGGSSVLILNAIKDIDGAKLYSIEKRKDSYKFKGKEAGFVVKEKFPYLMSKWNINTGGITSEFIEKIGGEIDLVFIDTVHITPGEILDWLQVLPFLKEEAIVVLHDTFLMYFNKTITKAKMNYSNNLLFTYIRGELILPSYGNSIFFRNIGALKLAKNQQNFYLQYFMALGFQWEYMPEEKDLNNIRKLFKKYYEDKYVKIFDDAVMKNKIHLGYL